MFSSRYAFFILVGAFLATSARGQAEPDYVTVPVNVSLWPGASVGRLVAPDSLVRNHLAINILAGKAGRLQGIELGAIYGRYHDEAVGLQVNGIGSVVEETMRGAQLSGFAAVTGASFQGVQAGGFASVVGEEAEGLQLGGFAAVAGEQLQGLQVGGFASITGEALAGLQVGGFASVVGEEMRGLQVGGFAAVAGEEGGFLQAGGFASIAGEGFQGLQTSGFASIAGEAFVGLQTSGFASIAGEDFTGLQTSGFVSIAGGTFRGLQTSGFANVADEVFGVQIGLVNVAREHHGVPIGLYSRVGGTFLRIDTWADETGFIQTAVRSGHEWFSNYVGVGARAGGSGDHRWGFVAGLGLEQEWSPRAYGTLDLMVRQLFEDDFGDASDFTTTLRLTAGYRVAERVALFGGPQLTLFVSDDQDGSNLAPWSIYDAETDGTFVRLWPGFVAGLRIFTRW